MSPLDDIAIDKRPTEPLKPTRSTLVIELDNPDDVAAFLEECARSIRERRRIVLIVE